MSPELRSFLLGTLAVHVLLVVGLGLTLTGGPVPPARAARRRLIALTAAAIGVQAVHFVEEWFTGFASRWPLLLGLEPWHEPLWVGFNLAWLGIWCLALAGLWWRWRAALVPVWLLALASALNGVAHPLLALAVGGYFPGLWTSPLCGVVGVLLSGRLGRLTRAA